MKEAIRGTVVKGRNSYCGPFAVGFCAGISPDTVTKYLRHETGQRKITDMGVFDIESSLSHFGCSFSVEIPFLPGRTTTLKDWFDNRSDTNGRYIVFLWNHFIVVDKDTVMDNNNSKGYPVDDRKHSLVHMVWKIDSISN